MTICIACGEKLERVVFTGQIKGMAVSFCDQDADWCKNCETITCRIVSADAA